MTSSGIFIDDAYNRYSLRAVLVALYHPLSRPTAMAPEAKREKSKKRERPQAAGASSSEDTPPLDATDTPGWAELTASLGAMQRCGLLSDEQLAELPTVQGNAAIGRYADLGGSVVRLLLQSLELHRTLAAQTESSSFLGRQRAEPVALTAADLISRPTSDALGGPLSAMQLPLYDRLAQAQQLSCLKFVQAMASADRDDAGGEGAESEEEEEEGAAAVGSEHAGAGTCSLSHPSRAFRLRTACAPPVRRLCAACARSTSLYSAPFDRDRQGLPRPIHGDTGGGLRR